MLFGGHVSIAGGLAKAVERGVERDFAVIQTFAGSPRSFQIIKYTDEQIEAFNALYKKAGLKGLFFHAIYLLNLASQKKTLVDLSINSLIQYLQFGEKVGSRGTIFHIGSSKERDFSEVKNQVVTGIKQILKKTPQNQFLIMEFAAGAGNVIGDTLAEMVELHRLISSDRLKICLDTQHLFASGINVGDYNEFNNLLKEFDRSLGIDNLICVHANDSKSDLGSHVDRHENIGQGKIGKKGFENILRQPLLQNKPFILETPGFDNQGPDKKNIEVLKELSLKRS